MRARDEKITTAREVLNVRVFGASVRVLETDHGVRLYQVLGNIQRV